MKALQLLDHVMLWVARIFAFCAFTWASYIWFTEKFWINFTYGIRENVFWRYIYSLDDFPLDGLWILFLLSNISLWFLSKNIGRIYLGLSSGLMLSLFVYMLGKVILTHDRPIFYWTCSIPIIGFTAMLWIAFRQPYTSTSPNPINLVNPI